MLENEADSSNTFNLPIDNHNLDKKPSLTVEKPPPLLLSKRFLIVVLLFVSNINFMLLEHNIFEAIYEMERGRFQQSSKIQWDSRTTSIVLEIFTYGKLLSFSSGLFISILRGSTCWALSTIICGLATILQPIFLGYHLYLFLACRFLAGIFQGVGISSATEVLSHWVPKSESGTLISFYFSGFHIGVLIVSPLCRFIAVKLGWSMVFYFTGITSVAISILGYIVVRNRPSEDKGISQTERSYIQQETNVTTSKKFVTHSYKKMLTSKPLWVLFMLYWIVSSIGSILNLLPIFMRDFFRMKVGSLISDIPQVTFVLISAFIAGPLLDFWRNRSSISTTKMHKTLIAFVFACLIISFLALAIVQNRFATVIIMILCGTIEPFVLIVMQMVLFNFAPNHTGLLTGFIISCKELSAIVTGIVASMIYDSGEWSRLFLLALGLLFFGIVTFTLYGSSEPQSWSLSPNYETNESVSFRKRNNDSAHVNLHNNSRESE